MKKLLSCLLAAAMLFCLAVTVCATEEAPAATKPPAVVPNESDLPDGYEIDPDFHMTITLDAQHDWSYIWEDLQALDEDGNEYVYFVVEEDIAEGYVAYYSLEDFSSFDTPGSITGSVVIVRNVKKGPAPTDELPKTGGVGTTVYTVTGTLLLVIAGVYGMILLRKRKEIA